WIQFHASASPRLAKGLQKAATRSSTCLAHQGRFDLWPAPAQRLDRVAHRMRFGYRAHKLGLADFPAFLRARLQQLVCFAAEDKIAVRFSPESTIHNHSIVFSCL